MIGSCKKGAAEAVPFFFAAENRQNLHQLGQALAALEILGVLSDARSMDFQHDVRFLHDLTYIELEKLCVKHGYTTEEPQ